VTHARTCATVLAGGGFAHMLAPRKLTHGSCIPEFEMVAATEQRRIERGQPTPQLAG
jgi:hypothetical protein